MQKLTGSAIGLGGSRKTLEPLRRSSRRNGTDSKPFLLLCVFKSLETAMTSSWPIGFPTAEFGRKV